MIHILVHDKKDTVGVAVVEGIKAGQEMVGWVMEDDSTIKVKAGTTNVIILKNEDSTADEFDSESLKTEKVVAGGGTGKIRLRPLAPGRYPFMGEFHAKTAQGVVIAE